MYGPRGWIAAESKAAIMAIPPSLPLPVFWSPIALFTVIYYVAGHNVTAASRPMAPCRHRSYRYLRFKHPDDLRAAAHGITRKNTSREGHFGGKGLWKPGPKLPSPATPSAIRTRTPPALPSTCSSHHQHRGDPTGSGCGKTRRRLISPPAIASSTKPRKATRLSIQRQGIEI